MKKTNTEIAILILLIIVCSYQSIFALKISYLDEILIIILGAYEILKIFLKKENVMSKDFQIKLVFILVFLSLTLLNNVIKKYNINAYIEEIFNYFKVILLIELISLIDMDDIKFNKIVKIFIVVNLISIIYGIFTYIFYDKIGYSVGDKFRNGAYRISGITGHPISLGFSCLIIIMYLMEKSKKTKWENLAIIICITALWMTQSRLPQMLCLAYLAVKATYCIGMKRFNKKVFIKVVLILIFICIIILGCMFEKIKAYLQDDINQTIRFYALMKSWEVLKEYPILGTGIGTFSCSASIKYNSYVYEKFSFDRFMDKATESAGNIFESSLAKITIETRLSWNYFSYCIFRILLQACF